MNYSAQKGRLTRAVNSGNQHNVLVACLNVVQEWDEDYWPDDWSRWQRALYDAGYPFLLDDLRDGVVVSDRHGTRIERRAL